MIRHADNFFLRNIIIAATATATLLMSLVASVSLPAGKVAAAKGRVNHTREIQGHIQALPEKRAHQLTPKAALIFFCELLFPYSLLCGVATSLLFIPDVRPASLTTLLDAGGVSLNWGYWLLMITLGLLLLLLWAFISANSYAYEVRKEGFYLQHGTFHKEGALFSPASIWSIRIRSDEIHSLLGLVAIDLEIMPPDTGMLFVETIPGLRLGNAKAACEKLARFEHVSFTKGV